ncbi:MAG TPA: VOC family protein [Acidimicrobiales bacterium]|nr:VOC family protein [Acidimicrobiales bacterium]
MSVRLVALDIADPSETWRQAGFEVDVDGGCRVGAVRLWLGRAPGGRGVLGWTLAGTEALTEVDGLPTTVAPDEEPAVPAHHPNGVTSVDHVVMRTPDLDRTVAALCAIGAEPRRTRPTTGPDGSAITQVFFRLGEAILELVGPPERAGDGPARIWGLAFTCADLDATTASLGDLVGTPRDAVQPGRRIATIRRSADLTVPVALMSTGPGRREPR